MHELQLRAGCKAEAEAFAQSYAAWLVAKGRPPRRNPVLAGQEVDLAQLYRLVMRRGGYNKATEDKAWRDVCRIMQARPRFAQPRSRGLRSDLPDVPCARSSPTATEPPARCARPT